MFLSLPRSNLKLFFCDYLRSSVKSLFFARRFFSFFLLAITMTLLNRKINIYASFLLLFLLLVLFQLVSASPNQRNWRGILIALLVIIIVLALIITSVVSTSSNEESSYWQTRGFYCRSSKHLIRCFTFTSILCRSAIKENVFELFKCLILKSFLLQTRT